MKPFTCLQNRPFPEVFNQVLNFHLEENSLILDPTPGSEHSWSKYREHQKHAPFMLTKPKYYYITYSTIGISKLPKEVNRQYDAIFFDPPYIFDLPKNKDKRATDYGEYYHSRKEVADLMIQANRIFPQLLKPTGKLFLKYSDVFSVSKREYYFCINDWPLLFNNFKVIDHYIIQHHHISGTAWQVKNRPCGIINYTYLTVFKLK